jgi:hypothetical protein
MRMLAALISLQGKCKGKEKRREEEKEKKKRNVTGIK